MLRGGARRIALGHVAGVFDQPRSHARQRRWCAGLTDREVAEMKREIKASVGRTSAASWMPSFAFQFAAEVQLERAVRAAHVQRGLEKEDPLYNVDIDIIPERDWTPQKPAQLLPLRTGGAKRDVNLMFEDLKSQLNWTPDRLWILHEGTTERKFVLVATVGKVPFCDQPPVAWEGRDRLNLWIDPDDRGVAKVYIQLNEHTPPLLWVPVQPKPHAVARFVREMRKRMVEHAQEGREFWERCMQRGEELITKNADFHEDGAPALRDPVQWERAMNLTAVHRRLKGREIVPGAGEKSVTLYLGPWASGDTVFEDLHSVNPFLHAWPVYRSFAPGGLLAETVLRKFEMGKEASTVDHSIWITRYSKTVIVFHHRYDLSFFNQMQWAEACAHRSKTLDRGVLDHDRAIQFSSFDRRQPHPDIARHQQFATIYYPGTKLQHGGQVIKRYNEAMRAELPEDVPVDVACALIFWRNQGARLLSEDVEQKGIACRGIPVMNHMELICDLPSPWNLYAEAIAKLGVVGSNPELADIWQLLMKHPSPAVRWGVAKSASLLGRHDILRHMWATEKDTVLATAINYMMSSYLGKVLGLRSQALEREERVIRWLEGAPVVEDPIVARAEPLMFKVPASNPFGEVKVPINPVARHDALKGARARKHRNLSEKRVHHVVPRITGPLHAN